jgi:large subunit ribosomal protein L10
MDNPRPEKVAVIDEVRARLDGSAASVVTEYRGLTVAELAQLRRSLTAAGGDYKVFKNTLVRRAVDGSVHAPLHDLLTGPTAIAFVHGDVSAVAKALRDFSRTNAHLVVKGGLLDGTLLSPAQLGSLADLPSRDVLLARLAGAIQAPLAQFAGLVQALPRNLAYGLKALVDQGGGVPEAAEPSTDEAAAGPDEPLEPGDSAAESEPSEPAAPGEEPAGGDAASEDAPAE